MKTVVLLCLCVLFAATHHFETHKRYSCFRSLNWGDHYLFRKFSQTIGTDFFCGRVKNSRNTVYGHYINETKSFHFIASYSNRSFPDSSRIMAQTEYQGFTYGVRRKTYETFWSLPNEGIFRFDCRASGQNDCSNSSFPGTPKLAT